VSIVAAMVSPLGPSRLRSAACLLLVAVAAAGCGDSGDDRRAVKTAAAPPPPSRFEDSGLPRTPAERRRREELRRFQRPVTLPLSDERPGVAVEQALTAEARRRHRAGELKARAHRSECEEPRDLANGMLGFECVAVTADGPGVVVGEPAVAAVDEQERTAVVCFRQMRAGEGASLRGVRVALEEPCRSVLIG